MIRKKTKKSKLILSLAAMAILPLSLTIGMGAFKMTKAEEETTTSAYIPSRQVDVTKNITNPSFEDGSKPYDSDDDGSVGNWSVIETESDATGMIIDVSSTSSSNSFSKYQEDTYFLTSNPKAELGNDSRILMINSKD